MWSELALYHPHTINATRLRKHEKENKIFQFLASLGSDFEDLRRMILMNHDLQSLTSVCATIQWEEARRKVMNSDSKIESHAYVVNRSMNIDRPYKGKQTDLKCHHCHNIGHSIGRCWILHLELKLNFEKEKRSQRATRLRVMLLLLTSPILLPVILRISLPIYLLFSMTLLPILRKRVILLWQHLPLIPWRFLVSLWAFLQVLLTFCKKT